MARHASPWTKLAVAATFFSALAVVQAASFDFSLSVPIQCQNMTVTVSGGTPPYQLIIIPVGTQTPEYRHIINMNLTEGATSQTFKLAYPTNTQFVALMSDATGVGTGGTGTATTVAASEDKSCLKETIAPQFFFYMSPIGYLTQCATTNLSWDLVAPNQAVGDVTFYGIIPGGETFLIAPKSQPYLWDVSVRAGTSVTIFAGDSRGIGSGGSAGPFVVNGTDDSCINNLSPSSTAGSPAGQVTQGGGSSTTSSTSATTTSNKSGSSSSPSSTNSSGASGGSGGGKSHTGAIVGGVVGGVVGLSLIAGLLFFLFCIRPKHKRERSEKDPAGRHTVDLAGGDDVDGDAEGSTPPSRTGPPMIEAGFYHPEPFVVPEVGSSRPSTDVGHGTQHGGTRAGSSLDLGSAAASSAGGGTDTRRPLQNRERRVSNNTLNSMEPGTVLSATNGGTSRGGRGGKSHPPTSMRPANFVQHEDAGVIDAAAPPPPPAEEVVELPPAYGNVRPRGGGGAAPAA